MHGKMFNIKISNNNNTKMEQFGDFEELFVYEQQRIEQECLLQQEIKYQQSIIKSKLKKVLKDGAPFTGDLRKTFPEYYNKCFIPIKKKPNNDFVFFKYYTDDGKGDDEESEDSVSDYKESDDYK
jgi:hypothetical protein